MSSRTIVVGAVPLASAQPTGSSLSRFVRRGRWVPWVLFLLEFAVTAVVIGILSIVLFVQLTLVPGAILGELDAFWILPFNLGFMAAVEAVGAVVVFAVTGLLVGVVGMPIRLVGPLRRWWLGNGEFTIIGVALGVFLLVIAYLLGGWANFEGVNNNYPVYNPEPWTLVIGWLLLAFSLSMLVWPARWMPARLRRWWTTTQLSKRSARATRGE